MKLRWLALLLLMAAGLLSPAPVLAQSQEYQSQAAPRQEIVWTSTAPDGQPQIHLYFFWSETCPHCREARPFVEALPAQLPWLQLHSLELTQRPENAMEYERMAVALGQQALYVPAFFFCGVMATGYDHADTTGQALVNALSACYADLQAAQPAQSTQPAVPAAAPAVSGASAESDARAEPDAVAESVAPEPPAPLPSLPDTAPALNTISLPLLGALDASRLSLPLMTVTLAGLDAFNPCAFFVLLFLLSLMVHAQNRRRMLLVGGIFVLFSGLVYFVFMAAWLNVFLWAGELAFLTLVAGVIAIVIALVNIKDYFWFKQGVSLSIPEQAKPGLYRRMRGLIQAGSTPALIAGTAALAIAANSYELLCTAGFPMVYTRVLTLRELPPSVYYGYLAAYNLVYILPLLAIVALFSFKFGARKLSEEEGRVLKLLSGLMMLLLGVILAAAPDLLNQVWTAVLLLVAALSLTALIVWLDRRAHHRQPPSWRGKLHPR